MPTILTIARRELTRLRSRFSGSAQPVVAILLVVAVSVSYLAYRQQAIRGRSLYRVGVAPHGPQITDPRFHVVDVAPEQAEALLARGTIDVYVDDDGVVSRGTEAAQYAVGALRLYLEDLELARVAEAYPAAEGFPLRVAVSSFPIEDAATGETLKEKEVMVPSLTQPPMPFEDVLKVSLHLFPLFLVSVFFTSGLMEEKRDRRISLLLSAPVSPLQIIIGKTLPYVIFSLMAAAGLALAMGGRMGPALIIFLPVVLFIFAVYLMVPLVYRTYKDTTFISMFVTVGGTLYLLFPAMFLDISDLSYISPLSLAVQLYRGEPFSLRAYLTASVPMVLISGIFVYAGSRMLNEEYLTRYRPLYRKLAEAVYLTMNRHRPYLSVVLVSLALVPPVYLAQLVILTVSLNLPVRVALGVLLILSILIEEVVKSVGIVMLLENRDVTRRWTVVALAFLSALGFLVGEKLLVLISVRAVSQSLLGTVLLNAGMLWIPLAAHFVFTTLVTVATTYLGVRRYAVALLIGSAVHLVYNLVVLGVLG